MFTVHGAYSGMCVDNSNGGGGGGRSSNNVKKQIYSKVTPNFVNCNTTVTAINCIVIKFCNANFLPYFTHENLCYCLYISL